MNLDLLRSAREGFLGSFKLAAMMVFALVAVVSGFVNGGESPRENTHSRTQH